MKNVRTSAGLGIVMLVAWLSGSAFAQVTFPDPNLESAVRSALNKPTGPIAIADMQTLKFLTAHCLNITNLSGLESATSLTNLDLSKNAIHTLSPLSGLSNLIRLDAGGNSIASVSVLSGLTNLSELRLNDNALTGIAPLTNLTHLATLVLYDNHIADVGPLAALTGLGYLELRWNPLTNADPVLSGLANLTTLYLGGTSISNVAFLQSLTRLTFLDLDNNGVNDLSSLLPLTNLNSLDVGYNPLTNAAQITAFTNIKCLYFSGQSISNASLFTNLSQLVSLTLCNNSIADVSPLAGLTNLIDLGLSWNPGVNFQTLSTFTNLSTLWLAGDLVSNLAFVEGLKSLKALGVDNDFVSDLTSLSGLTNLVGVFAAGNRLTNIVALDFLPQLGRARLNCNLLDLHLGSVPMEVIQDLQNRAVQVDYLPQNQPPAIAIPSTWTVASGVPSSIGFFVSDDFTPGEQLLVTASSANANLLPDTGIAFSNPGPNRTMTVTSAGNQTGATVLTLTVTDGAGLSTRRDVLVNIVTPQFVTIVDPKLEAGIRLELNKPVGDFTTLDMQGLTYLGVFSAGISNLSGLEWATNLTTLFLSGNLISDITPIGNLSQIKYLSLDGNHITNLFSLAGLTNLEIAFLNQNRYDDISPLDNLLHLSNVDVRWSLLDITNVESPDLSVIEDLLARNVQVDFSPQREPPEIGAPTNWIITMNSSSRLYIYLADNGPSGELLSLGAASSDTNQLPSSNWIIDQETSEYWSLTVPPISTPGIATITLRATNDVGMTTTLNVVVTIVPPLPLEGSSVGNLGLGWQTAANAPWFEQSIISYDGISSLQSGTINSGGESWIEANVQGPGVLSYWWKVSSQTNHDYVEFYLNDVLQSNRISGEVDWTCQSVSLPLGNQKVRWRYWKNPGCCSDGIDAAWLDQVTFAPSSWLEPPSRPVNGQCTLLMHLVPGKLHELQISTNLVNWSTLNTVITTNDTAMSYLDTGANVSPRFYRLYELPESAIWLDWSLAQNQIQMMVHSPPGFRFEVQTSSNLSAWSETAIVTNTLGTVPYTETLVSTNSPRFFRVQLLP
jgi:internalin A